ncbi:MAG: hypothetical protein KAT10_06945 [Sulfurimonas sp.]|nr:hypothetical protein [Sulfurimonas sp.]
MFNKKIKTLAVILLVSSSVAFATINDSPHDLAWRIDGTGTNAASGEDNGEICVYCHTPHAANTSFDGAPLWNKGDGTAKNYMMYGATVQDTIGGTIAGTPTLATPASPSLACLSCHDGISGIDSIVNAPGSGMGGEVGNATDMVTALTGTTLGNFGGNIGGTPGTATGGTLVNLANDHPVSIQYDPTVAGVASLRPVATVLTTTNAGATTWMGATTISDLLRGPDDRVECGSCHDPHNGGKTQGVDTEVNFLRHSNTNSELCIGCHDK